MIKITKRDLKRSPKEKRTMTLGVRLKPSEVKLIKEHFGGLTELVQIILEKLRPNN
jgi:hypothetical protein